jgi:Transposase, Mutator family/Transposase domain (DUF772)
VGHAGVALDGVGPEQVIYATIEAWRNRPIEGDHPYVYLDGIVLKRSWERSATSRVNERGNREILGICEGAKEDKTGWSAFVKHIRERGLKGVRLIPSDACHGLAESAAEFFLAVCWKTPRHGEDLLIQFFYRESAEAWMRGVFSDQGRLFSYISPEARVPANHPLRKMRKLVRDVLGELNRSLSRLYASEGRPSIPPEQLLSALLLQVFYSTPTQRAAAQIREAIALQQR